MMDAVAAAQALVTVSMLVVTADIAEMLAQLLTDDGDDE